MKISGCLLERGGEGDKTFTIMYLFYCTIAASRGIQIHFDCGNFNVKRNI